MSKWSRRPHVTGKLAYNVQETKYELNEHVKAEPYVEAHQTDLQSLGVWNAVWSVLLSQSHPNSFPIAWRPENKTLRIYERFGILELQVSSQEADPATLIWKASREERATWSMVPSVVLKMRISVPRSEAVASSLPSRESAMQARAVEWAWMNLVRLTS